ncbi:MAG: hypothetical protein VX764_09380 [Planctomycetota bacterium]|nr:hypothetical protein [Planctomycetota bacterium]
MDNYYELGTVGTIIFLFLFALLAVLLPFSVYAAQKWAYRTYRETKKVDEKLGELLSIARKMSRG